MVNFTAHRYHRIFPLRPPVSLEKSRSRFGSFWKLRFSPRCGLKDTLVQVIHTVIFAMQKCQVPISSGLAGCFLGSHMGMTPLQSFGPHPCGLGHIHWEITNFRCILLGVTSWKSFHGYWIVAKEQSSVSKQPLQPVLFGRRLKRLHIFQYLHAVLEIKCCNANVSQDLAKYMAVSFSIHVIVFHGFEESSF